MDIKSLAEQYNDYIIDRRRYYHTCPELSGEEKNTRAHLKEELEALGTQLTEQTDAAGHILPAFIKAKRFDLVGVFLVNLASHLTESDILPHIGRQHHQIGTKLLRLPDGHAGFDATWLCYIVGSKDDSVTGFWITADCHRLLPQFRAPLTFHRCIVG